MTNLIILLAFLMCAAWGFALMIRSTRQLRAPRAYKNALLTWDEKPRWSLYEDVPTWLAINIHRFSALALGAAVILILLWGPPVPLTPDASPYRTSWLLGALATASTALAGFLWGYVLAGPLAEIIAGPRHFAVSEAGLLGFGQLYPWDMFNRVSYEQDSGMVRLWSASLHGTIAFSVCPPDPAQRIRLLGIARTHVPTAGEDPGPLRKYAFPAAMAAICAPVLAIAAALYWVPPLTALMALCLLTWLLLGMGASFIMRTIYGNKSQPADVEAAVRSDR